MIQLPKPCRSPRKSFAHPVDTDAEEFRTNLVPAAVHPLTRSTNDVRTSPRTTPPRVWCIRVGKQDARESIRRAPGGLQSRFARRVTTRRLAAPSADRGRFIAGDRTSSVTDAEAAIEEFLRKADAAYEEYDQGYVDADATLRRLEGPIEDLREAAEA